MPDNKTKKIDIKNSKTKKIDIKNKKTRIIDINNKDRTDGIKKVNRKISQAVDTGSTHDVTSSDEIKTSKTESNEIFSDEYRKKYKNLFMRIYRIINKEELNEENSETIVRLFGIISGMIILFIILVVIALNYFLYVSYSANIRLAVSAEASGRIDTAISYYEKAYEKTNNTDNKVAALENMIDLSEDKESKLNLKTYLIMLAKLKPEDTKPVLRLKEIFIEENDIDSIIGLAEELCECKSVECLYDIVNNRPVFNYKSGTYNEFLELKIQSGENCRIYYTLDNAEATEQSTLYEQPILIGDIGKTTINAVSINEAGIVSDNYSVTYNIVSDILDVPSVYPKSGSYDEETEIAIDIPVGYDAYYTLDGTEPDRNSLLYEKGMIIPYGNHIFTVKFIAKNSDNESESSSRVYIYESNYNISLNKAVFRLRSNLINAGKLSESDGQIYNILGNTPEFDCTKLLTFDDKLFYCINMTDVLGSYDEFAVSVDNGAVFKLMRDQYGKEYLSSIE